MASKPIVVRPLTRRGVFETVATFAIIVTLLYLGAGILVPLVLAILLAFALSPLVEFFAKKVHLPEPVAVLCVIFATLLTLGVLAYVAAVQVMQIAGELPAYQTTIMNKLRALQEQFAGGGFLNQISGAVGSLSEQLTESAEGAQTAAGELQTPVPVTVANDVGNPLGIASTLLGTLAGPLATAAIVVIFLIFLLLGRRELQERFIRLVSRSGFSTTSLAMGDASQRVGRYLLLQLVINVIYGTLFAIGLLIINVPGAILWGLMIMLFRYIPFIGGMLVACIPVLLSFAVDAGWGMLLSTVGLFLVIDLTTANVVEPRVYGSSTGVSPIAILLSAMFWATLWGPVGLILATPMTVCLVVIGRYIPQFKVLETLLGSEPVLAPSERLYQRLLRGGTEEAIQIAEEIVDETGLKSFQNQTLLPALRLASDELSDAPEAVAQRKVLANSIHALIEELRDVEPHDGNTVVLIGGRTEIDGSAALVVSQRLATQNIASRVLPPMAVRQESVGRIDLEGAALVCLFYFGSEIKAQTRYVARRLRLIRPEIRLIVCQLNAERAAGPGADDLRVDQVTHDFDETVEAIDGHVDVFHAARASREKPFKGAGRGNDALGQALKDLAERLGVPVATINLLEDERHREDAEAYKLTQIIAESGEPLVIRPMSDTGELASNSYLQTNGVHLYAGVPLVLGTGEAVGSLVVFDYDEREFGEADTAALQAEAETLVRRFSQMPEVA